MKRQARHPVIYYTFDSLRPFPLAHAVFTRIGGVSDAPFDALNIGVTVGDDADNVATNVARMAAVIGTEPEALCWPWLAHSNDVAVAEAGTEPEGVDGLITDQPGLPLVMTFADCVPLILYDPVQHVLGLAHAGWRGTVAKCSAAVVQVLGEHYGTDPADIRAGVGPSISPERYEVGPEVIEAAREAFGPRTPQITTNGAGKPHFDLWEANRITLSEAGVQHIEVAGLCTATNTDEFFSYRAEGKTGRFGVMAMLQERTP